MTNNKRLAAEHLFDAVGELDDSLLTSALNYRKPKAKILTARPVISTLGALAAVLVLAILVFPNSLKANDSDMVRDESDTVMYSNLTVALSGVDYNSNVVTLSSTDEVDLFDGQAKVIWKNTDSDVCYALNITETDLQWLQNYGTNPITVPDESCQIWLTAGDGLVVSPCLKKSAGNVGYGEIFNYSPEVDVSPTFANYLTKLIT